MMNSLIFGLVLTACKPDEKNISETSNRGAEKKIKTAKDEDGLKSWWNKLGKTENRTKSKIPPLCEDIKALKRHEGRNVQLRGRYVFPKTKSKAVDRLLLKDGTTVILSIGSTQREMLRNIKNDKASVAAEGTIFIDKIPEEYRIKSRSSEPYLLDIVGLAIGSP